MSPMTMQPIQYQADGVALTGLLADESNGRLAPPAACPSGAIRAKILMMIGDLDPIDGHGRWH